MLKKICFILISCFIISTADAAKILLQNDSKYPVSIIYGEKAWDDSTYYAIIKSVCTLQRTQWWLRVDKGYDYIMPEEGKVIEIDDQYINEDTKNTRFFFYRHDNEQALWNAANLAFTVPKLYASTSSVFFAAPAFASTGKSIYDRCPCAKQTVDFDNVDEGSYPTIVITTHEDKTIETKLVSVPKD
jgi:hypothetical protein